MEFFDKLGRTANKTYKITQETATKLTKEAKLKFQIREDKLKIKDLYEAIGERIYENFVREDKQDITEFIQERCEEIDVFAKEIEEARKDILALKNIVQCKICYKEIDSESKFCPNCGEKQEDKLEVKEENNSEYVEDIIEAEIIDIEEDD